MGKKFRIGLLTTIDSPLLTFFISNILAHKLTDIVVICDSKKYTDKDRKIWLERTGGVFDKIVDVKAMMIPFYFVNSHNDEGTLDLINFLSVDVLLNAGTPRKLNKHILEGTKYGVINIHPGVLPYYRGCSAVEWAIFNDDKIGNTAHFMTEGYDEGNIIFSEWYKFKSDADYKSIRVKVYREGIIMAGKALKLIFDKRITSRDATPQNHNLAKYYKPIPDKNFSKVIDLINRGQYKYQIL
jgi:methionyl-tRNA formyltransferase